ncbi:MAG: Tol-Pal system beta propeller repeat protein TolB [Gammaproteobacteria bacterium]|nr:Tol-Pal system beta propeller repeat protein TolB [Gammaproteobacteria bacterium]
MSQLAFGLDLELTQGVSSALPIGIDSLGSSAAAQGLSSVIRHDLSLSGQFKMIDAVPGSPQAVWKAAGADSVVVGHVNAQGGGQYGVHVELLDPMAGGKVLIARDFQVKERELRALAHFISDLVYEKLTGERGVFSTRIAYVLVTKQQGRQRYLLEVADADGVNPQSLLSSPEPIMSPAWSPDGKHIACVSFENKRAQIYMIDVETGQRRLVTSFPGINGAPAWSPDGRSMAVVLSRSGSPKVYQVELQTGAMKQLTFGTSIDTEPRYAPDGKSIIFTSGRGGGPQIYRLSLQDGQIKRMTFDGNYNAKASLTPNQARLVMLHREDSRFMIAAQDLISNQLVVLSGMGAALDESPSVAPNGRMVIYATRDNDQGLLEIVSIDGRVHMRLPSKQGDVQEPAWSPYLG